LALALVAIEPTFTSLYHILYNSWQTYRFEKRPGEPEAN
jgi:hypothetical protein